MAQRKSKVFGRTGLSTSFLKPRNSQISCSSLSGPDEDDTTNESLDLLIRILKRPINQRNLKNLQTLIEFARSIRFFRQGPIDLSEETITQCCVYMTYEFYPKGEYVFRQGDLGSKFYILLEGSCTVFIYDREQSLATPVNQYSRGDSFGELALIQNKPRAASVACNLDSHFAVLEKEDYARILAKVHEIALNKKAEFLQTLPLFASCTRSALHKLIFYFKERSYERKQILHKRGAVADAVYFIREGEVQILQDVKTQSPRASSRIVRYSVEKAQVAILGQGECIGLEDVLDSGLYQYTCVCHSQVLKVLTVSKDDFLRRVNTDETCKASRELIHIKDVLRKDQILCGKHIREALRRSLAAEQEQRKAEKGLRTSAGSPTEGKYTHLYPLRRRGAGLTVSPTSETGLESVNSIRRLRSWHLILEKKRGKNRSLCGSRKTLRKVVNIHRHNQRVEESKRITESRISLTSRSTSKNSPQLLSDSLELRPSACLTINCVEVLPTECDVGESRVPSPRFDRIVKSPHSQFRLKKIANTPSLIT